MSFSSAHPSLLTALTARGYSTPTPVQAAILEERAAGHDLLVSAQTGSGKTVAFGLAIAPDLLGDATKLGAPGAPRALVIAPTRELALQVQRELAWLYAAAGGRVISCVGGMDIRREQRELYAGAHIVVGTPGRLRDHLEHGAIDLSALAAVVLDEADEMLDLGFKEELEVLLQAAPSERRTLMFSATIPRPIAALAKQYQKHAVRIAADGEAQPHGDIEYRAMAIVPRERDLAVVNLLRWFEVPGALVFCATRDGVTHLAANLAERGFAVAGLSGELSQAERNRALSALRDGRAKVCVATDVAARGLDLPDLGLVIHADLPRDKAMLLHRSGRTGRAGKKGVAVVLVPAPARMHAERLFGMAGVQAQWMPPPAAEEIVSRDRARLADEIVALAKDAGDDERAAATALLAVRTPDEIAAALVRLHRAQLPAPEELTVVGARPTRAPRRDGDEPRAKGAPFVPLARGEGSGGAVWYRMNLGRMNNADPRWLIPLICARGDVTKDAIGAIRIGQRESRFEIAGGAVAGFEAALAAGTGTDRRNKNVKFERLAEGGGDDDRGGPPRGPRPPRRDDRDARGHDDRPRGPRRDDRGGPPPRKGSFAGKPRPRPGS